MDAETTLPLRRPGRIRRAWDALLGRDPAPAHVCVEIVAELQGRWRDYEMELNSYMEKMNAWAARQAKRDKRAIERQIDPEEEERPQPMTRRETKASLRRQLALRTINQRGLAGHLNGGDDP